MTTVTKSDLEAELLGLPRITLTCAALGVNGEERIIVEGDRGIDPAAANAYALERIEIAQQLVEQPESQRQGLLGRERDGKLVRWSRGKVLTYSVVRESFVSVDHYERTRDAMTIATTDWMNLCGVRFEHKSDSDSIATPTDDSVVFRVAGAASDSDLVALAFFPDDKEHGDKKPRVVFVLDPWFGLPEQVDRQSNARSFDPIGVMRHEIGHVLGFRHEHIRPEAPQIFGVESLADTRELTEYDPTSVMHYLAQDVGDPDLNFTSADEVGARQVYGGPDSEYFFVP